MLMLAYESRRWNPAMLRRHFAPPKGCPQMAKDQAPDPRTQSEKFADLARELECDESEEAFAERLKRMAKAPKPARPED